MAAGSATGQTGSNAWSQLDQLLTCAICLDRYRNPKLLPCQHTFCMEPCLEGLIDYVRRQIKCPECRAEHRIPYQGIQGYPTNVTLMRFLELHFEVTGEVPDPTPAMMERCGVCTEKSYLGHCAHCDKKVCTDCKESHLDIMKREISRINNQVRRGLNRLQDALGQTEKSTQQLQTNCKTVLEEIEEIYRRLQKGLKDREEALKAEVLTFLQNELRSAEALKENLDTEVSNIQSNSELVEKHVTDNAEWDDVELMEYKDTFLRTLEFLRNFDPDQADFSRRLKFQLGPEPEAVHQQVVSVGELTISAPNFPGSCVTSTVGTVGSVGSGMLMRSKSEHRLASSTSASTTAAASAQRHDGYLGFAQRVAGHGGGHSSDTETRDGRSSPLSRRRTGDLSESAHQLRRSLGERGGRDYDDGSGERSYRRYGRSSDHIVESRWQREDASDYTAGSYRSRFGRESGELQRDSSDGDVFGSRSVRFARQQQQQEPEPTIRERVLETEDATRGPLSGICRLMDSPRVMERLQQQEQRQKQQQVKQQQQPPPAPTPVVTPAPVAPVPRVRTARQVSEEDEIAKQKAQNKKEGAQVETSTTTTTQPSPPPESPTRALVRRVLNQTATETSETEAQRRRYGTVTTTARSEDASDLPRRPASRQMSRDVSDSETVRPPSRQTSVADAKETSSGNADKSTASSESSSKEDDSPAPASRRRFFPRTQSERPSILKGSGTSAITESNSDSDSDAKTPTPQAGTASTLARQPSLEDVTGQEKPNYFRYRTAAYSRSPSNSSVNLDSQDESGRSGALSPTPSQQPQYARPKTPAGRSAIDDAGAKERSKSTDSSSSGSSDSSSNATQSRSTTTAGGSSTTTTSTGDKSDSKSVSSRYAPFRGSVDVDKKDASTAKDDGPAGVSAARVPSLAVAGRAASLDKRPDVGVKPRFVSRFLPRTSSLCKDDKRDSDSSDSDSDDNGGAKEPQRRSARESEGASTINALLARSAIARRDNTSSTSTGGGSYHGVGTTSARSSAYARDRDRDEAGGSSVGGGGRRTGSGSSYHLHGRDDLKKDAGDPTEGRYSSLASKYLTRSRTSLCEDENGRDDAKYGGASYASRYLSKSKSSAALGFERDGDAADESSSLARRTSVTGASSERYGAGRKESRYGGGASVRRSRLGRSKSSHEIHGGEDDDDDDVGVYGGGGSTSAERETESSRVGAYRTSSRFERPSDYAIARSRSHHALNSRDPSPEADTGSSALSSWARYLKAKYGNKGKEKEYPIGRSSSSHALYSREASSESSEEERGPGTTRDSTRRDSTVSYSPGYGGLNSGIGVGGRASAENPRSAYLQKRRVVMKIGARGSDRGSFTWPRGIAVGLDNSIVVADSSNHRVQVFDANGSFCKEFGAYGSADGEFDCLAGVAVNRIGQYIVSDRYNHRIQVFDPSGRFLRAFGSQGSVDGKLSYPWGVATDSLGFIYVCDKENHRVQVFQSDGTFVGKFGSLGNKPGQLEHPHYVAVSSTNKVVVSDSNNHRIQIFDVNGRVLSAFGSEGSDEGQFKFPRGVAVDDQGYIIVGDSGNNRIQVFQPDGTFLKAYGTWGSGDGEFKGLEGVAVTSNANILVCDRENHRIQIF